MTTATDPTILIVDSKKSQLLGFVLTFIFGPLGLLYASVIGGVVMILLTLVVGFFTLGIGFAVGWIVSIIWSFIAIAARNASVNGQHKKAFAGAAE